MSDLSIQTATGPGMSLATRQGWMYVGKAFQDCHEKCETCAHKHVSVEREPYGETYAERYDAECVLGERAGDDPTDCPAYRQHLQFLKEEAEEI